MLVGPVTVPMTISAVSFPFASITPPPDDPSCATAVPPSATTSAVVDANVYNFLIRSYAKVGYNPFSSISCERNCAAYDPMITGSFAVGALFPRGTKGNTVGILFALAPGSCASPETTRIAISCFPFSNSWLVVFSVVVACAYIQSLERNTIDAL